MISLMIGPPGGGKSYEAVVYHLLPAIVSGRKVITNLPINVDELRRIEPAGVNLLELRHKSRVEGARPFSVPEDYGDDWRASGTNQGPLYIIDEAHKAIPRRGFAANDPNGKAVDEWHAEHRHEGADVLHLSQSVGKLSKAVIDQVQVCYRVKKMTLWGESGKYIRKVQDGVRGDVLSTAERVYLPHFFSLYKSHTRTEAAVIESDAAEITPAHVKWKRAAQSFLVLGGLMATYAAWSMMRSEDPPDEGARTEEHAPQSGGSSDYPNWPDDRLPTALAATSPSTATSATYRLVGVFHQAGAPVVAAVFDGESDRLIVPDNCTRSWPTGWTCEYQGHTITHHTGAPPKQSSGGGLFASFSPKAD